MLVPNYTTSPIHLPRKLRHLSYRGTSFGVLSLQNVTVMLSTQITIILWKKRVSATWKNITVIEKP